MTITVDFRFHDAANRDVTGTDEVAGYHWADYFGDAMEDVLAAKSVDDADRLLKAAYKGSDVDGIGVVWTLENQPDA